MRVPRFLGLIAAICFSTALAGATPVDFHMRVLDPPPPTDPSIPLHLITSTSFDVSFTPCLAGELPGDNTATGCFAGQNISGQAWDSMQLVFPNTGPLVGQDANCDPGVSDDIFSNVDCPASPGNSQFTLIYTDGLIANRGYFFITEDGVDPPTDFPTGRATVGTAMTPEPGSIVLLSTGIFLLGGLVYTERLRNGERLCRPRFSPLS
ncbi:MAG TPA: hypothetical protein VGU67_13240 [Edaphobacter sp.]|nr:hypothetical protein [Edaphobacter sp.]